MLRSTLFTIERRRRWLAALARNVAIGGFLPFQSVPGNGRTRPLSGHWGSRLRTSHSRKAAGRPGTVSALTRAHCSRTLPCAGADSPVLRINDRWIALGTNAWIPERFPLRNCPHPVGVRREPI
jgi:hypothetical protein